MPKRSHKAKAGTARAPRKSAIDAQQDEKIGKLMKDYRAQHMTKSNQAALGISFGYAPVTATVGNCMPATSQGLGEGERTGDTLNGSLDIQWVINALPYDVTTNPDAGVARIVRVMIGYLKDTPNTAPTTTVGFDDLLRDDNQAVPWTGIPTDEMRQVNRELFTIAYDKKFIMGANTALSVSGANDAQDSAINSTNEGRQHIRGRHTAFKNRILRYNDTESNFPTNAGYFIWAMFYRMDGTAEAATILPYQLAVLANLRFTA